MMNFIDIPKSAQSYEKYFGFANILANFNKKAAVQAACVVLPGFEPGFTA